MIIPHFQNAARTSFHAASAADTVTSDNRDNFVFSLIPALQIEKHPQQDNSACHNIYYIHHTVEDK
jgi:hypothetical protein